MEKEKSLFYLKILNRRGVVLGKRGCFIKTPAFAKDGVASFGKRGVVLIQNPDCTKGGVFFRENEGFISKPRLCKGGVSFGKRGGRVFQNPDFAGGFLLGKLSGGEQEIVTTDKDHGINK